MVLLALVSIGLQAQSDLDKRFSRFPLPVNVPNIYINDLVRDQLGLLWIATYDGLIRFGSSQDVYIYNTKNTPALKSNQIETIYADSKGLLWLGTRYGGLTSYNRATDEWQTYTNITGDTTSLSNNEVLSICEDSQQRLWIGTEYGLNLFDRESGDFTRFISDKDDINSLSRSSILNIFEDQNNLLWIGTWDGGVNILMEASQNIAASKFKRLQIENNNPNAECVWRIFQDGPNKYWIGSHFSGVYYTELTKAEILELNSGDFLPMDVNLRHNPTDRNSLPTNVHIRDMEKDAEGNLWITTSDGLAEIRSEDLERFYDNPTPEVLFRRYTTDPYNVTTLPSEETICLYKDKDELLWLGTDRGIASLEIGNGLLKYFDLGHDNNLILTISDIFSSSDGNLFLGIGQDEYEPSFGGLGIYDFEQKKLLPVNEVYPFIEKVEGLKKIVPMSADSFLIVDNTGIREINTLSRKSKKLVLPNDIEKSLREKHFRTITKSSDDALWFAFDGALYKWDIINKKAINFSAGRYSDFLSDLSITDIAEDSDKRIWVSTYSGLNCIEKRDTGYVVTQFVHDSDDAESLPGNRIVSMVIEKDVLYMGTLNGLITYDISSQKFETAEVEKGKLAITKVINGGNGEVWASSKNKVIYYDQETSYTIRHKDFNIYYGAIFYDQNDFLWVAGQRGFVRLDYNNFKKESSRPVALIPGVTIFDSDGSKSLITQENNSITLAPEVYRFEVSFCSDNLQNLEFNQYAYRMVGFEDEWIYTNITKPIAYTNLDPGSYRFEIKTSNDLGQWSKEPSYIDFELEAAYWETSLFKWFSLLFALLLIYVLFKLYNYRVVKANAILKQEISKRIETEEELKVVNAQLKETSLEMERFAFVASHDLKEPLRTIGAFSSLLNRKYDDKIDDKGKQYLGHITQGVSRMYSLIESLLNYSSNKEANLEIERLDLNEVLQEVGTDLSEIISAKNAQVLYDNLPHIYADKVQLHMLLANLIKNGLKFNQSSVPTVTITEAIDKKDLTILSIKDNGIGIPKEKYKEIFVIFKRLHGKSSYEGSGIGLALCKKIMERHQGEIWLESAEGEGTTFFLGFPASPIDSEKDRTPEIQAQSL